MIRRYLKMDDEKMGDGVLTPAAFLRYMQDNEAD
jgi:hypothetical protein